MIQPKKVGEGSYGCVHNPPLTCVNQRKQENSNKVSKILTKRNAQDELNEFFLISEADKNGEYHLGRPTSCTPAKIDSNMLAIKDCERLQHNHERKHASRINKKDMNKFMLLIMKDGGYNIEQFSNQLHNANLNKDTIKRVNDFLIEGFRLLEGLSLFLDHNIIHHDLKAQNIVYNPKENRINFIDFGLMNKISNVRREANNSKYGYGIHWSFPFEISLWNKSYFERFFKLKANEKRESIKNILTKIKNELAYTFENIYQNDNKKIEKHLSDYMNFLATMDNDYDQFLHKSLTTFDLYGVGLAFMNFYNDTNHIFEFLELEMDLKTNKDTNLSERFHLLFLSMIDPNVYTRIDVKSALYEYQDILVDSGILDKDSNPRSKMLQQTVENMGSIQKISTHTAQEISTLSNSFTLTDKEQIQNSTPKVKCPEGKEYNRRTKRCVKKCKDGYQRNEDFKCVKIPKSKTQKKKKSLAPCSEGKERNPKTNRCIKKCKPGYKRNEDFKCVKSKN